MSALMSAFGAQSEHGVERLRRLTFGRCGHLFEDREAIKNLEAATVAIQSILFGRHANITKFYASAGPLINNLAIFCSVDTRLL